ncbi:MAG: GNAT family N-acetyltransferase [Halioglobus sp.]
MQLNAEFVTSMTQVDPQEWEGLCGIDYPFLSHRFLLGLEESGCTNADNGWQPCHMILRDNQRAVAALPLYLKSHSYGEYVFDWSWSQAWEQSGLQYYPKLISAIPFTPATGPRLCHLPELSPTEAWDFSVRALEQFCRQQNLSSWHLLFPDEEVSESLLQKGIHQRRATQFHWFNNGYQNFEDFLAEFSSRKRKSLKRERRRVQEQGLQLVTLVGDDIGEQNWERFYHFYQYTYAKRSGHGGYLTREFFTRVAAGMGDQVIMVLAQHAGESVAAALYFRSADTLYGRYWGCEQEFDCLHFEACYYQGIEFCIEHGIKRFDPGAQGEHKIQRGFRPVETFSNHWIADSKLSAAVGDFTRREKPHSEAYLRDTTTLLPFKQ